MNYKMKLHVFFLLNVPQKTAAYIGCSLIFFLWVGSRHLKFLKLKHKTHNQHIQYI